MCRNGWQHVRDDKLETRVIEQGLRISVQFTNIEMAKIVCFAAGLATRVWRSIVACLPGWPNSASAFFGFKHRQSGSKMKENLGQPSAHILKTNRKKKGKSLRLYIDNVSVPSYTRIGVRRYSEVTIHFASVHPIQSAYGTFWPYSRSKRKPMENNGTDRRDDVEKCSSLLLPRTIGRDRFRI